MIENVAKFMLVIGICLGSFFMGYEFGTIDGQALQKLIDNDKLKNCLEIISNR